jgi:hypothetical protein
MKPYYTKKGKYSDGRNKIAIEDNSKVIKFLPKPEFMLKLFEILSVYYPSVLLRVKNELKYHVSCGQKATEKTPSLSVP